MQKVLLYLITFLVSQMILAQENKFFHLDNLRYETGFYTSQSAKNWGIESNLITGFTQGKNIFEGVVSIGIIGDFGKEEDDFIEEISELFTARFVTFSVHYGRNIPLSDTLFITGLTGPSYVYATDSGESGIGANLKIRFNFQVSDKISLGLSNNMLLSTIDSKLSFTFFISFELN